MTDLFVSQDGPEIRVCQRDNDGRERVIAYIGSPEGVESPDDWAETADAVLAEWLHFARLFAQAEKMKGLLKIARCPDPNCDNEGCTVERVQRTESGCCGHFHENGECCGNAVPVPVEDIDPAPCQWCHEQDAALAELSETNDEHSTESERREALPHWVQQELNRATRQFRHNDDNSPNMLNPEKGFEIAYDREIIDAVIRRALAEPAVPPWQPIETAPRDGTHFLAYEDGGDMYRAAYHQDGYFVAFCGQPVVQGPEPILWMPLPSPPEK